MKDTIDLTGGSGATYRFQLFRDGRPLSPMGGNFLFVREEPFTGGFTVLFSGEGENLLTGAVVRWAEAEKDYYATHLYTRLNISQSIRRHEHQDVLAGYRPPMNPEAQPDPGLYAVTADIRMGRPVIPGGPDLARDRPDA